MATTDRKSARRGATPAMVAALRRRLPLPVALRPNLPQVTAWESLPLVLNTPEMAQLLRCSPITIRHRISRGLMKPPPAMTNPARWLREVVRRHLEDGSLVQPATTRRRRRRALSVVR